MGHLIIFISVCSTHCLSSEDRSMIISAGIGVEQLAEAGEVNKVHVSLF